MDKQMTDEEKNGLLKNICVSEDKLEDYLNAITLGVMQSQKSKGNVWAEERVTNGTR